MPLSFISRKISIVCPSVITCITLFVRVNSVDHAATQYRSHQTDDDGVCVHAIARQKAAETISPWRVDVSGLVRQ